MVLCKFHLRRTKLNKAFKINAFFKNFPNFPGARQSRICASGGARPSPGGRPILRTRGRRRRRQDRVAARARARTDVRPATRARTQVNAKYERKRSTCRKEWARVRVRSPMSTVIFKRPFH